MDDWEEKFKQLTDENRKRFIDYLLDLLEDNPYSLAPSPYSEEKADS